MQVTVAILFSRFAFFDFQNFGIAKIGFLFSTVDVGSLRCRQSQPGLSKCFRNEGQKNRRCCNRKPGYIHFQKSVSLEIHATEMLVGVFGICLLRSASNLWGVELRYNENMGQGSGLSFDCG